jgi:hypothetical protein
MDFDNFIIGKKWTGKERGELAQKKAAVAYQSYIEVSKKSCCCFPNIEDRKVAKIATAAYN